VVDFAGLSEESLSRYHDNIRRQLEADRQTCTRQGAPSLTGSDAIRDYASRLEAEMRRRYMRFDPIEWWQDRHG
jgi:hypothetical protein